jgi:uncharacterized membrane-anchored protein
MAFTEHPLRRWAVNEMHLRRFAPVGNHCEVYQVVRLIDPGSRDEEDRWLMADKPDFREWSLAPRHGGGRTASNIYFLWERHTEASTITLIFPHDASNTDRAPYVQWMEQWPGAVVRATKVFVVPVDQDIEPHLMALGISSHDMVCCEINAGMRIWSDFGIHEDGYGRLLVSGGDVGDSERGRIIQRVQELGNYRNLALLGFPTVQEYGPPLDALERKLSEHAKRVAVSDQDDETLLSELAGISSELELIRSATGFRLSATAAYAEVAADRLASLDVRPIANYQSLTDFTERRLVPASRTCTVFKQRLGDIAERISGIMHTLDVQIDSRIKAQNLRLMQSMERSTQLQVRLQTLVEGLSVIAAAYYLIGLLGYVVKGVGVYPKGLSPELVVGAATIPIILVIYWLVGRLRNKVLKEAENDGPQA